MDPVAFSESVAIGLAGQLVSGIARTTLRRVVGHDEPRALAPVIAEGLRAAVEATMRPGVSVDAAWWREDVSDVLRDALSEDIGWILAPPFEDAQDDGRRRQEFLERARSTLDQSDHRRSLEDALDVDEFLWILPDVLRNELFRAAVRDGGPLRDRLSVQFLGVLAAGVRRDQLVVSPGQRRADVRQLLLDIERDLTDPARLPVYLPPGADITRLNRPVNVLRRWGSAEPPEDEDERQRPRRVDTDGSRRTSSDPELSWLKLAGVASRVVVHGAPGIGKSWLLRTEACRLARDALRKLESGTAVDDLVIPVAVRCDELATADGDSIGECLVNVLGQRMRLPPSTGHWLLGRIASGGTTVLLDAWDELPGPLEQNRIKDLLAGLPDADRADHDGDLLQCVITTRPSQFPISPLPRPVTEVELLPFDPADINAVVGAWTLPVEIRERLLSRLAGPALAEMARNPLLLALLCSMAGTDEPLPTTRWQLFDQVIRQFLRRDRARPATAAGPVDDVAAARTLRVLGQVAMHFATRPGGWQVDLDVDELADVLDRIPQVRAMSVDGYEFASQLRDSGLLVSQGTGSSTSYRFLHQTIAEYLVSRQLVTQERWLDVVEEHLWFDADWDEVIPMLGGQLGDPALLLDHLLDVGDDPFHLALRTAARVVAELPTGAMSAVRTQIEQVADRLLAVLPTGRYERTDSSTFKAVISALAGMAARVPDQVLDRILARVLEVRRYGDKSLEVLSGAVHRPQVRKALLGLLAGEDTRAGEVVSALAGGAGDPEVRRALVDLLEQAAAEPETKVGLGLEMEAAVQALSGSLDREEVRAAVLTALDSKDYFVRKAAQEALTDAPEDPDLRRAFTHLVRTHPDEQVRVIAADALGKDAGTSEVRDALIQSLSDDAESSYVRASAAISLTTAVEDEAVREALLEVLVGETDNGIQECVLIALAGAVHYDDVRAMFVEKLSNDAGIIQIRAERGLADVMDLEDLHEPLLELVAGHSNADVRAAAIRLLAYACDQEHVRNAIIGSLRDDPDFEVCRAAARALTGSGAVSGEVRDVVAEIMARGDRRMWLPAVRVWSASASVSEARNAFVTLLRQDPDGAVRREAMSMLTDDLDTAEVRLACVEQLDNDDVLVRQHAMDTLALALHHADVVHALVEKLRDTPHSEIRSRAGEVLAGLEHDEATESGLLELAQRHWLADVRASAIRALGSSLHRAKSCHIVVDHLSRDDTWAKRAAQEVVRGEHNRPDAPLDKQLVTICEELDRSSYVTRVAGYDVLENLTYAAYRSIRDDAARAHVHRVLGEITRDAAKDLPSWLQ